MVSGYKNVSKSLDIFLTADFFNQFENLFFFLNIEKNHFYIASFFLLYRDYLSSCITCKQSTHRLQHFKKKRSTSS